MRCHLLLQHILNLGHCRCCHHWTQLPNATHQSFNLHIVSKNRIPADLIALHSQLGKLDLDERSGRMATADVLQRPKTPDPAKRASSGALGCFGVNPRMADDGSPAVVRQNPAGAGAMSDDEREPALPPGLIGMKNLGALSYPFHIHPHIAKHKPCRWELCSQAAMQMGAVQAGRHADGSCAGRQLCRSELCRRTAVHGRI